MLRDYEILYIVRPELDEPQLQEAVTSVNKLIENLGGASQKTDVWGRRRLAYEVGHIREGQYVLTDFQIEPARVPEMEATLKISDSVFRHLIVRKPDQKGDGQPARAGAAQPAAVEARAPEARAPEPRAAEDGAGAVPAAEISAAEPSAAEIPAAEPSASEPPKPDDIDDTTDDQLDEPAEESSET